MPLPASVTGRQYADVRPGVQSVAAKPRLRPAPSVLGLASDRGMRAAWRSHAEALGWTLQSVSTEAEAREILAGRHVPIVFLDGDDSHHCWRRLVGLFRWSGPSQVQCIVFFRNPDTSLWAEVLNLGGYDLVSKPLDAAQLAWVVESARLAGNHETSTNPIHSQEQHLWIAC